MHIFYLHLNYWMHQTEVRYIYWNVIEARHSLCSCHNLRTNVSDAVLGLDALPQGCLRHSTALPALTNFPIALPYLEEKLPWLYRFSMHWPWFCALQDATLRHFTALPCLALTNFPNALPWPWKRMSWPCLGLEIMPWLHHCLMIIIYKLFMYIIFILYSVTSSRRQFYSVTVHVCNENMYT